MTTPPPPGSRRAERAAREAAERGRRARPTGTRRRSARKPRSRWRTVRRTLLSLVALGMIGPVVAFMVAYIAVDVPRPSDIQTDQVANVLYADGSELARVVPPEGNRTDVSIAQVPDHVQKAVLSAEDRSFETNPGFSLTGIVRATLNNVSGGDAQGASTITQQYVKNALVGNDQTLTRKMRELVISTKMARQSTKDEILEAYLNTIYFGRGAYGIAAASTAYFGKPVEALTVSEGAVLASSIRSPSAYDPETDPEAASGRWTYVLDGMVEEGWLSQADRDAQVYPAFVPLAQVSSGSNIAGPEGLVVRQVRQELTANGISEQQLNQEGLQITTTIDPRAQQGAVDAVAGVLGDQPADLRTAVVSIDPRTGAVRAYYGGADGVGFDYAQAQRSGGSSMKVFTTAAALAQGIPLGETYDGSSPRTISGVEVNNSEGASCGRCTVAEALKRSLNTVFFELAVEVGPQAVVDTARAAGIPTTFPDGATSMVDPDGNVVAGVTLGVGDVRPIDMASAYATFANNGTHAAPYFVQKVTTADGEVLLDRGTPAGTPVIDPAVAQNVTAAMEPIAEYSRDHELADGRESAAKTGTNQFGDSGNNRDGWMVGYTPSLSTAVWIGNDAATGIFTSAGRDVYGSGLPADIWQAVMNTALEGTPQEEFPEAPPIAGQDRGGVPEQTEEAPPRTTTQQAPPSTTEVPPTTTTEAPPPATTTVPPTTTTTTVPPTTTPAPTCGILPLPSCEPGAGPGEQPPG